MNAIEDLLDQWEAAREAGAALTPEQLCQDHPELLHELRRRVALLQAFDAYDLTAVSVVDGGAHPATPPGDAADRYRRLALHARGGLGEVYVAQDRRLGRPVAVKRMQDRHAHSDTLRMRFLRETIITARLQHPGIVPVYDESTDAAGRPVYVMRFVDGETLEAAIARLPPLRRGDFAGSEFRALLSRFVTVCNTIAYAHAQGVIHRDIKPANILLGRFGETLVVDWGMAKAGVDDPLPGPSPTTTDAPDLLPTRGDGMTEAGDVLGTPAYMSPEQAQGRWQEVDARSDVYSLGATMYHLLTGCPPFEGGPWADLSRRIATGDFPKPRARNPATPPALSAICRRAMAVAPADRYASALDLAADLEHWLADEPVAALPDSLPHRAGRWIRRHRTVATTASAVALLAGAVLAYGVVALEGERRLTARQRDRAQVQQLRLRQALDDMLSDDALSWLVAQPDAPPEQKAFLNRILMNYQRLASDAAGDDDGGRAVADACHRVAQIHEALGDQGQAEAAFRRAVDLLGALVERFPDDAACRLHLGMALSQFGWLLHNTARDEMAKQFLGRALAILEPLAVQLPEDVAVRNELAGAHNYFGTVAYRFGQPAESLRHFRRALELYASPPEGDHERPMRDLYQAEVHANIALVLVSQSATEAAEAEFHQAADRADQVLAKIPGQHGALAVVAQSHSGLADLLMLRGDLKQAETHLVRSRDAALAVAQRYPSLAKAHRDLGNLWLAYGRFNAHASQWDQAAECYRKALQAADRVAELAGNDEQYKGVRAYCRFRRGEALGYLSRWDDARKDLEAAADEFRQLLQQSPGDKLWTCYLGASESCLGMIDWNCGSLESAVTQFDDALRQLDAGTAGVIAGRLTLATTIYQYASLKIRGTIRYHQGRFADALADHERSLRYSDSAQRPLSVVYCALCLARLSRLDEAVAKVEEAVAAAPLNGQLAYEAACCYGIAADGWKSDPAKAADAADRAMELLGVAIKLRYRGIEYLRGNTDFNALRDREEFKKLLDDLPSAR